MNTKTTLALALVAVVVAAYLLLVEKPWEERAAVEAPTTTAKLLFDPKPEDVDRVEVTVPGRKDPQRVFKKQDDAWVMVEPIKCPADKYQVDPIVDKAAGVKYLKAHPAGSEDRPSDAVSGLTEPAAIVKLFKGDQMAAELQLGSRLPTGKGNYIQRGGSDVIYESEEDLSSAFTKRLSDYRNKQVVKAELDDVSEVEVTGVANFKLVKSGDDWMIEEPMRGRADKNRANRVARQIATLRVKDWVPGELVSDKLYGFDEPRLKAAVLVTKTVPPKARPDDPDTKPADTQPSTETATHVVLIGGEAEDKTYFARLESAPWLFTVSDHTLKELAPDLSELREKTLAKIDLAKVTRIAAQTPAGSMTLTQPEKNKWTLADGTECDTAAVEDLIKAVRDLKAANFVDPGELLIALNWDNPRAQITLTQKGRPNPTTVLVGPPTASGKMVYVRNAAEEAVAAVHEDEVDQLLAGPVSYRDRKVMTFPRGRAQRIEITRAGADPVALAKTKNKWSMVAPVEAAADADAVRNLLQDLASLRAKRVAGLAADRAKFGLDAPPVTLAVHLQPVGAEPGAKVVGQPKTETQPAEKNPRTQPAANPRTKPAANPATTRPAAKARTTRPADDVAKKMSPEEIERKITNLESLLQYQKDHPDEEKPELTKIIRDRLAELRASTQPSGGPSPAATQPAGTTVKPAEASVASAATKPAQTQPAAQPPPTIYRLLLSQRDGKTYACRDDGDMVYELDDKVYEDATAEMHDRQIAKFEVDDVAEVTFGSGDGLTFRKSGDQWKYAPDPVLPIDKQKVTEALNDFRDLKTHHYVAYAAPDLSKYELDRQTDRVAVALAGGERIEILVSKRGPADDPDNSRYAVRAGSKKVFLLKGEQADKFARKLDDFAKAK